LDIIFLGGARDFHAIDWYRAVRRLEPNKSIVFITDSFEAEGMKNLTQEGDHIERLFIIDRLLFSASTQWAHRWRNIIKLVLAPLQAFLLRKLAIKHGCPIVHAHSMYFMLLSKSAGLRYLGTPQGDELLVRPKASRLYRAVAGWLLRGSAATIVDSEQMKAAARDIAGIEAKIVQNGINVREIEATPASGDRFRILSIRGFTDLYRIREIVLARDAGLPNTSLTFIYPFSEPQYVAQIRRLLREDDEDLGRQEKLKMFKLLKESLLVVSIPLSDSSPRSVYEAIFSGCSVAAVPNPWIDALPECMRRRIFVADLQNASWLADAYEFARANTQISFVPSAEALSRYDEEQSLRVVVEEYYGP
jgi:hypothetical protein